MNALQNVFYNLFGVSGYKCFHTDDKGDLYCQPGYQKVYFKEGVTHKQKGVAEICNNGFHFCKTIQQTRQYYDFSFEQYFKNSNYAYAQVVGVNSLDGDFKDKLCATNLKIKKVLSKEEVFELFFPKTLKSSSYGIRETFYSVYYGRYKSPDYNRKSTYIRGCSYQKFMNYMNGPCITCSDLIDLLNYKPKQ